MKKLLWILLLVSSPFLAEASHMVSGYISYRCLGGTTYLITFYNYANTCNEAYDQDTMTIHFGDGTSQTVSRINGPTSDGFPEGVQVCSCRKICLYQATHTYPGSGHYRISVDDPARMAQITNMVNSANEDFYVFSDIILGADGDSLIAPVIANPLACVYACPNQCYTFNMGAYSASGDSIAYSLGNCLGTGGGVAAGYYIPSGTTIDPSTGTLKWCSPPTTPPSGSGIYNFAILLIDYKRIIQLNGRPAKVIVDTTECELEVLVQSPCNDEPPVVFGPSDTCVEAGDLLKLNYTASDVVVADRISLIATGAPFSTSPAATTNSPGAGNPVNLTFTWSTNCTEVRRNYYPLLVTATVINPPTVPLNAYQATNIHIVGPAPTNLTATPIGNAIQLNWNPNTCPQVSGYQVYRHINCYKWIHGPCETGVPAYTGYSLIGTTTCPHSCTSFLDNNGGRGLTPGVFYDYMVVATYPLPDGSLSYASVDTCLKLRRDVPIISNVSVTTTGTTNGNTFVRWIKPLADANDLDTIANPGPYSYVLKRATGINGSSFSAIATFSAPFFKSAIDTAYIDALLNTQANGYNYKIDFYSNSNLVGSSPSASSIYLSIHPDNNMLHLSWQSTTPWADSSYNVYRTFPPPVKLLANVPGTQTTYTDSNLTNLKNFCYYVESKSYYPDTTIAHPLFDSSEVMCGTPKDTIPPCPPHLKVTPKCTIYKDSLVWDNPDYFCPKLDNRILYYEIWYSPSQTQELQLISTIYNLKDTTFIYDSIYSIAGCFAVIAVDSFMNKSPANMICVDNCPEYTLPNIFTPNGDGKYDFFTPILPYRFIKDIDINIYNRWGQAVFHTINPMINWDGKDQNSGMPCSDGVYYYICQVNEIHLDGIHSVELKGFIQILR